MTITLDAPASPQAQSRYDRITRRLELPMGILALAVIPALLLDDGAGPSGVHAIARFINWIVWLAFGGEFLLRLALAPDRGEFVKRSWFDLLIVVLSPPFGVPDSLQGVRALRALRLLRLVRALAFLGIGIRTSKRALRHRKFHYVLVVTSGVILLGATALYVIERQQNAALGSFADSLWWAFSTTTGVGQTEVVPRTGEGKLVSALLMVTSVTVVGIFTATLASLFMIQDEEDEFNGLHKRLDDLEAKMDRLLTADRR
jgi:voltage-gated potassium channel